MLLEASIRVQEQEKVRRTGCRKLYHLMIDSMKQRLGNVLHAHLSEEVALASLYRIHRLAQSVGNIIHRM